LRFFVNSGVFLLRQKLFVLISEDVEFSLLHEPESTMNRVLSVMIPPDAGGSNRLGRNFYRECGPAQF
jgi:hypothetical protein